MRIETKSVFLERLKSSNEMVRKHAMNVLRALRDEPEVVEAALAHLSSESEERSYRIRASAAAVLSGSADPHVREQLRHRLHTDSLHMVRVACGNALKPASNSNEIDSLIHEAHGLLPTNGDGVFLHSIDSKNDYGCTRLMDLLDSRGPLHVKAGCVEALKEGLPDSRIESALRRLLENRRVKGHDTGGGFQLKRDACAALLSRDPAQCRHILLSELKPWRQLPFFKQPPWKIAAAVETLGPALDDPYLRRFACNYASQPHPLNLSALKALKGRKEPEVLELFARGLDPQKPEWPLCAEGLAEGGPEGRKVLTDFFIATAIESCLPFVLRNISPEEVERFKALHKETTHPLLRGAAVMALRRQKDQTCRAMIEDYDRQHTSPIYIRSLAGTTVEEGIDFLLSLLASPDAALAAAETLPVPEDGEAFDKLMSVLRKRTRARSKS